MDRKDAKDRILKLHKEIDDLRYRYHVLNDPTVSDNVYDSLTRELKKLEETYPEFLTPDSPTQRVGGKPLDKFVKVTHRVPMLSLTDAFDEEEFRAWEERNRKLVTSPVGSPTSNTSNIDYFAELKVDGFAVSLIYEDGILKVGATRGDGKVGEDVTQNLKTIRAIPLRLRFAEKQIEKLLGKNISERVLRERIEIRGEVYMSKKAFAGVNREQKKKKAVVYANPRNLAAGSIRQLDPAVAALRDLDFMAYNLVSDLGQEKHSEEHAILKELGFKTVQPDARCKNLEEVIEFREQVKRMREKLKFEIDGVVVSINENNIFQRLSIVGKAPRGSIAFKFPGKEATTVVKNIIIQVGRTGVLTPVAILNPVNVGGVTVSRATLHNMNEIERLDVRIGDTVVIQRAGDVIPDIVRVLSNLRPSSAHKFHMPPTFCSQKVGRLEGEVAHRILHPEKCDLVNREKFYHFVSKKAFDIQGLGPKIVDRLLEEGLTQDPADLFLLKEADIQHLERFAEKSAENLIKAIREKKEIEFTRFIYALGIPHVGEETAIDLTQRFGTLEKLAEASEEKLAQLRDVGPVVAKSIFAWFHENENRKFIEKLKKAGVVVKNQKSIRRLTDKDQKLSGLIFVLTGGLETMTRDKAKEKIRKLDGEISESVSKKTDFVIAGSEAGSKLKKAKKLGIKIINEEELLKMTTP